MPPNGWRHSAETKQKLSILHKGSTPWNKGLHIYCGGQLFEKGYIPWNKGRVGCYKVKANLEPSPVLSYILGVLAGDGWVVHIPKSGTYRIGLSNSRKGFADEFAKALENIGLHCNIFPYINQGWGSKLMYRVQASSRMFVDWYDSLLLADVKKIALQYPDRYLWGFFQSEGSCGNRSLWMTNTNKSLVLMVQGVASAAGFNFHILSYLHKPDKHQRKYPIEHRLYLHGGRREIERFLSIGEIIGG